MSDDANDQGEGGFRWMTYRELAAALAISLPAAEARVRRGKWRKQEGNDGTLRISVPIAILQPSTAPTAQGPTINVLLDALKAAHEATAEGLRCRAEDAEARAVAAESRAANAEAARDQAAEREHVALAELHQVQQQRVEEAQRHGEAKAALARLTVELEEARLPWWRRALFRRG